MAPSERPLESEQTEKNGRVCFQVKWLLSPLPKKQHRNSKLASGPELLKREGPRSPRTTRSAGKRRWWRWSCKTGRACDAERGGFALFMSRFSNPAVSPKGRYKRFHIDEAQPVLPATPPPSLSPLHAQPRRPPRREPGCIRSCASSACTPRAPIQAPRSPLQEKSTTLSHAASSRRMVLA